MAAREPAWFRPEQFCREVLRFIFRMFDVMPPETAESLNRHPEEFREAVEIVGKSVFTLQMIMRDRVRPLFIESINLVAGVRHGRIYHEISKFTAQGYLHGDIFNTTLSCFAIVAELLLFMDDFGFPVPPFWYHVPWCAIYEHRLKRELASMGGWEILLEKAALRNAELYKETLISIRYNIPNPYAEVRAEVIGRDNWPINPFEFVLERFGVAPQSTTLAMGILRELYAFERDMIPVPGAGADAMRLMLGLQHPAEADGN
ncbi:hypothetical protein AVEN_56002-1 [Araneus ventricosus]|uniref:Uncharacterized protein n=1 Tax=Araneus ventricosus TaxID=182803 RepID=A0A4Y2KLF2_ARAVE|nr:hypothetical protein AVEN_56002-1 [Araneus ventricosus]